MASLSFDTRSGSARHPAEHVLAFAAGAIAGALIGATAAILLAPSDGETFRRRLLDLLGVESDETAWQPAEPLAVEPLPAGSGAGTAEAREPSAGPTQSETRDAPVVANA